MQEWRWWLCWDCRKSLEASNGCGVGSGELSEDEGGGLLEWSKGAVLLGAPIVKPSCPSLGEYQIAESAPSKPLGSRLLSAVRMLSCGEHSDQHWQNRWKRWCFPSKWRFALYHVLKQWLQFGVRYGFFLLSYPTSMVPGNSPVSCEFWCKFCDGIIPTPRSLLWHTPGLIFSVSAHFPMLPVIDCAKHKTKSRWDMCR